MDLVSMCVTLLVECLLIFELESDAMSDDRIGTIVSVILFVSDCVSLEVTSEEITSVSFWDRSCKEKDKM
jgi:hypothetical protein